jgi:hypothetical protein
VGGLGGGEAEEAHAGLEAEGEDILLALGFGGRHGVTAGIAAGSGVALAASTGHIRNP